MKKLFSKDVDIDLDDLDEFDLADEIGITLDDLLYLRNVKNRELWLRGEITDWSIHRIISDIREYNRQDYLTPIPERIPIKLFIDSNGGATVAGLSVIDVINASKTPVWTINISKAYSMAFQIMISGHKRFAFKNSSFLLHDGSEGGYDSSSKFRDRLKFNDDLEKIMINNIVSRTKISEKEYEKNVRREWYMLVPEALELGIVDQVVNSFDDVCTKMTEVQKFDVFKKMFK